MITKPHICGLTGDGYLCPACEVVEDNKEQRFWRDYDAAIADKRYCGPCDAWFHKRHTTCPLCGADTEKAH